VAEELLALDHVSKRYGTRAALSDVSFRIGRGEVVGYLGPNGAGKSTTLKLCTGLASPSSGTVRIAGGDPTGPGARRRLGALVETPGVPPYLRGADLLQYCAGARGLAKAARADAVRQAAAELGVEAQLGEPFGTLSTGLGRRMLIAAALVGDPELLLLDEPTLGLDPLARRDLRELLRRLAAGGRTVLLSTHLLDDVEAVCGRVLFLREGRLVGDDALEPRGPGTVSRRALRLTFARDVTPEEVLRALGPEYTPAAEGPRRIRVSFTGSEVEQAETLARVVRAGLPLVGATAADDNLAERYLEVVGREEES
jgi:ABC-2 type transport system ATP-binding protein